MRPYWDPAAGQHGGGAGEDGGEDGESAVDRLLLIAKELVAPVNPGSNAGAMVAGPRPSRRRPPTAKWPGSTLTKDGSSSPTRTVGVPALRNRSHYGSRY